MSHPGIDHPASHVDADTPRGRRVVYVGRLEAYKKIEVMLRAMARLTDEFPDCEIWIVGRGQARDSLESVARELGLGDRTHFTGFVDRRRARPHPPRSEGLRMSLGEGGMGPHRHRVERRRYPVVATDADGLRDSVQDGKTGFLVADEDVAGFAERIGQLLRDDRLACEMSRAAARLVAAVRLGPGGDEMASALARARGCP